MSSSYVQKGSRIPHYYGQQDSVQPPKNLGNCAVFFQAQ